MKNLILKKLRNDYNYLVKEENDIINIRSEEIYHNHKKSSNVNALMIKSIIKSNTIVITLLNTEVLHIAYVIKGIV